MVCARARTDLARLRRRFYLERSVDSFNAKSAQEFSPVYRGAIGMRHFVSMPSIEFYRLILIAFCNARIININILGSMTKALDIDAVCVLVTHIKGSDDDFFYYFDKQA